MNSHIYKLAVSLVIVTFITGCVTAQKAIPKEHEAKLQTSEVERLIADLKFLSSEDLKGRETGTPGNRTAREYIIKRFKESGVQHASAERSFIQPFRFVTETKEEIAGANVVGVIKGRNESGGSIVISAHYDHLGVREGQIYNGTDDNASGTAALIAFADYFNKNKPVHDLIFVAFDAEEKGHSGAKHFVKDPVVPLDKILLNVNLDMIARGDKKELFIAGTYHYPQLKPLLSRIALSAPVTVLFGHDTPEPKADDWTIGSDHYQFHKKKIPFIYFGVEDHPDYHKPTDDFEKVDLSFYKDAVTTILMGIVALDRNLKE